MLKKLRSRLTLANAVSLIALFLALGGSSYALTVSGRNIQNNTVTSGDVKDRTLRRADVAVSQRAPNAIVRQAQRSITGTSGSTSVVARCEPEERALGGSAEMDNAPSHVEDDRPWPAAPGEPALGWEGTFNSGDFDQPPTATVWVVCASP